MGQQYAEKNTSTSSTTAEETTEATPGLTPEAQAELNAINVATDEILNDIDDLLETNAEEFVAGFVQKGGQ